MILALNKDAIKYIVALSVVIVLVLLLAIIIPIIIKKKNKDHVRVDDDFMNEIISSLGGAENIKEVSVDNARLKVGVGDLSLVRAESLHKMSEKGVFITGNNVKMMFKYDSNQIKKEIEKRV